MRDSKNRGNPDQNILSKLTFSYDATNNILSNGENNYSYDSINQLTSVDKGDGLLKNLDSKKQEKLSIDYNYDNLGNRDSVEQMLSWTTKKGKEKEKTKIADYTNNSLNQYTSVSSLKRDNDDEKHGNSGKFVYDKNGNLIQDSNQRYSYDYRNRLVKVASYEAGKKGKIETNLIAEFSYDVLGRRIQKTTYNDDDEQKKIVRYVYSNQDAIEETSYGIHDGKEKLKDTKEYIYGKGIDDVLSVTLTTLSSGAKSKDPLSQTKTYFYQKDQLGSLTAITDDKGKLVEEYKYDEFGKAYTRAGKSDNWKVLKKSDIGNVRLFTGREYDKEIGLYYYRARYYSAELGRFISRDPIGTMDNVNLYSYVGNSPVMYVDGMGREKKFILEHDATLLLSNFMQESKNSITASDFPGFTLTARSLFQESEYNIKYNQDFLKLGFKESDSNLLKVFVSGEKVAIIDLGNFLIGYNGFQAGFTLNNQTGSPFNDIYQAGLFTEDIINRGNYANDPLIYADAVNDELKDRPWYNAGFQYATTEKTLSNSNIGNKINVDYTSLLKSFISNLN